MSPITTTFQLSDKGGETGQAILLIKVEAPADIDPAAVWQKFVVAVAEAGLSDSIDTFDYLKQAVQNAKTLTEPQPVQVGQPPTAPAANVTQGPWGQPPVPPMVPAAAQQAPLVAPSCVHGVRQYISGITKSGKNAGKQWQAWACPMPQGQQCDKEWIRD